MYPGEGQRRKGVGWQTGSEGLGTKGVPSKKRKRQPSLEPKKAIPSEAENSARYTHIRCGGGNLAGSAEASGRVVERAATTKAPHRRSIHKDKTSWLLPGTGRLWEAGPREAVWGRAGWAQLGSSDSRIIKQWVGRSGLHWLSLTLSCALPCGPENNKENKTKLNLN